MTACMHTVIAITGLGSCLTLLLHCLGIGVVHICLPVLYQLLAVVLQEIKVVGSARPHIWDDAEHFHILLDDLNQNDVRDNIFNP